MKKNLWKTAVLAAGAAILMTVPAFAATRITNVSLQSGPDEDVEVTSGSTVSPVFSSSSEMYEVSYTDTSNDDTDPKKEHTYEIRLDANDGYYFPKETEVNVSVSNVSKIIRKDTEDDTTFIVRVRAYPYYQWPEVTGVSGLDGEKITWDKGKASKWEYVLEYTDIYGNDKVKHGTTTKNYLDVKSYNKEYTGSNEDRQDSKVTAFAVRAIGNAGSNQRVADGVWSGNADYSEYSDDYSSWGDAVGNRGSSGTATSGSTGSSGSSATNPGLSPNSSSLPSYVIRGTWSDNGNGNWSFTDVNGHRYVNEWAAVDNSQYANTAAGQPLFDWFYFDGSGNMYTGWLKDANNDWYYLQTESNGTRGAMFTGWHIINGKNYHFNENSDGTRGKCLNPYI